MDQPGPKANSSDREAVASASIKPNFAGLVSRGQRGEMRVLLAGKWPALKPLPVFKYETEEYRAAIDFDKLRGEWVCRKTSFPSNKIQELRGGLTELTRALPHGSAEAFGSEDGAADEAEEELAKDAARRAQAMAEWRKKQESGGLYSELESYLSKNQQEEIYEIIRLTLTARQLQFLPKNVAYVFDALSKAGGRLATLVEIGQRKKAGQGGDVEEPAREFEPEPMKSFAAAVGGSFPAAPVENGLPAAFEKLPIANIGSVFGREQASSPEVIEHAVFSAAPAELLTPDSLEEKPLPLADQLREKDHGRIPLFGFGRRARAEGAEFPAEGFGRPPARTFVLEISGLHVAAFSLLVLFAAVSLTVGLNVGGESFGKRLRDVVARDASSSPEPNGAGDTGSRNLSGGEKADKANDAGAAAREEKSKSGGGGAEAIAKAPAVDSKPLEVSNEAPAPVPAPVPAPAIEPKVPSRTAIPEGNGSSGVMARNKAPRAYAKPAHLLKAAGPISSGAKSPGESRIATASSAIAHVPPPATILVRGPGNGNKPFRLTLPEKTIAASHTFAMSAQFSVLVAHEPGMDGANGAARLHAGEVVSYVWPTYPKAGDRHGAAETVKVRTIIGKSGQVEEIKLVSGSASFFSAAASAIRQWRFTPTLLDERPVQAQEDVTIAFRR